MGNAVHCNVWCESQNDGEATSWGGRKNTNQIRDIVYYIYILRVQMQKPLNAVWNFLLKLAFLLGSHVQVQKLYINGNEKVILI